MAEGAITSYLEGIKAVMSGEVDLVDATIKVALVSGYTPAPLTEESWDDISSYEISGAGYTAGGATLQSKTLTKQAGVPDVKWDGGNTTWTGFSEAPNYAVIYVSSHATKVILACVEIGTPGDGAAFSILWHASGIATIG